MDHGSSASSTRPAAHGVNGAIPNGAPSLAHPESTEDNVEDYDKQELDPTALTTVKYPPTEEVDVELDITTSANAKAGIENGKQGLSLRLEKTGKKGRYMLRADDPEIREILQKSLAKQTITSQKRKGIRDLVFTRRFTTFDRQSQSAMDSPFHGFFTLFWLAIALMLVKVALENWRTYGNVLGRNEVLNMMMSKDVILLGLTDGVMCAAMLQGLVLQLLIQKGYLSWEQSGYIIQNIWQTLYLGGIIGWTFYRDWPWTHSIFIVLHAFVFLMKQHSYNFYNGYLSQVYKRKQLLTRKLGQLQAMSPLSSPVVTQSAFFNGQAEPIHAPASDIRHRRKSSMNPNASPENLAYEPDAVASVAKAISSNETLSQEQLQTFTNVITEELDALTRELKGKCVHTQNHYPANLNLANFAEWTVLPTLVYELEYPRQDSRNWWYIAEKTAATFGCIGVMMVISQAYIYPPVLETVRMKEAGMSVDERWQQMPWIVSDMLFPLLLEQLLTWYVIWECILNVLAELTLFADRGFYGDWWNSVSWDQYARDWNRPVHNFLLRHVYHSSISAFRLSKTGATFATFLLSACVHELLMFVLFKRIRGYLFTMQLLQMPLAMLSRTKMMRGRDLLGNVIFWIGLFVGPSVLTSLYLVI